MNYPMVIKPTYLGNGYFLTCDNKLFSVYPSINWTVESYMREIVYPLIKFITLTPADIFVNREEG